MLKRLSIISVSILGLAACGGSSNSGNGTNQPLPIVDDPTPIVTPPGFETVAEAAQADMQSNDSAAVSIAIYKEGEIVYSQAFGNTRWGGNQPVNTNTLFQLGSTTKMFTSLAAMQLVDQGIISVDDTLTSALPGIRYPAEQAQGWQDVNIHHLMSNQSGFQDDYETLSETSELVSFMLNQYGNANPQMVEPGRFFNYSNPNFSFLGALVEYATQQGFTDVMAESVFAPLGMARSTMLKADVISDGNYAFGVYEDNDNPVGFNNISQMAHWLPTLPAGVHTWSTPTELLKMAEFLMSGDNDVLSDELRQEMTTAHVSMNYAGLPLNYGYGIFIDDGFIHNGKWYAEKTWQHGGNTQGYTSTFWMLPEKDIAVAILSSGDSDDYHDTMIAALDSVTDLPTPGDIPFSEVDTAQFDKHSGTYDAGFLTIHVTNNNGVLNIQVPELDAEDVQYSRALHSLGGNTFIASAEGDQIDITFFPQTEEGDSVYLRNRNFVGIREGSELSARPDAARQLKTESFASKLVHY